jgi:hypothetical protein
MSRPSPPCHLSVVETRFSRRNLRQAFEVVSYISDYKVDVTSATPGRMLVADSSSHIKQRGEESYLWGVPFGP